MAKVTKKPEDKRLKRGEESRKLILKSAVKVIASIGMASMTLDRVAEKAGISRTLVVFHFKSKNRLLEEVLRFLGKVYADGWQALKVDNQASNADKLLQLVDYDIDFAYQYPQYVSAWHAFWGEAKGNRLYRDVSFPRDEQYGDDIDGLVETIVVEGNYNRDEAGYVSTILTAMLFGIWIESHLNLNAEDRDDYKQAVRVLLSKSFPDHYGYLTVKLTDY